MLCLTSMMVQAPLTRSYKSLELSQEHTVRGRVKNLITTGFSIHGGRAQKVEKEGGNSFATSRRDIQITWMPCRVCTMKLLPKILNSFQKDSGPLYLHFSHFPDF